MFIAKIVPMPAHVAGDKTMNSAQFFHSWSHFLEWKESEVCSLIKLESNPFATFYELFSIRYSLILHSLIHLKDWRGFSVLVTGTEEGPAVREYREERSTDGSFCSSQSEGRGRRDPIGSTFCPVFCFER